MKKSVAFVLGIVSGIGVAVGVVCMLNKYKDKISEFLDRHFGAVDMNEYNCSYDGCIDKVEPYQSESDSIEE